MHHIFGRHGICVLTTPNDIVTMTVMLRKEDQLKINIYSVILAKHIVSIGWRVLNDVYRIRWHIEVVSSWDKSSLITLQIEHSGAGRESNYGRSNVYWYAKGTLLLFGIGLSCWQCREPDIPGRFGICDTKRLHARVGIPCVIVLMYWREFFKTRSVGQLCRHHAF